MQGLRRAAVGLAEGRLGKPWNSPDVWGSRPEPLATLLCRKQSCFLLSSRGESFQQSPGRPLPAAVFPRQPSPCLVRSFGGGSRVSLPLWWDSCCLCVCAQLCSPCCCPGAVAPQAPPSVEFARQDYWSGSPFPPPGDLILGSVIRTR